ncbi:MAG: hypothetical protein ACRDRL_15675 [Sciscionella sp.]
MNIIEKVSQPHREIISRVLHERAPQLLSDLLGKDLPTYDEVEQVEEVMYAVVVDHFGSDQEPDAEGLAIEDALVAFVGTFPNDDLPDSPLNAPPEGAQ